MIFVAIGAFIGLLIGRFPGLVVGAAIGYAISWGLRQSILGRLQVAQSELIESTFSIMGALCKADRVVSRDEIRAAETMFDRLHLNAGLREEAKAAFNRGKEPDFDLDAAVDRFARIGRGRGPLLQLFLQIQVVAVAADGNVHPAEHEMLVRIARRLGLSERDVAQLEALLRAASAGPSTAGGPPSKARLEDAYAALGVSSQASDSEVKRAYRKLMSQNHPDKLVAKGLPESMMRVAQERTAQIRAAYETIRDSRGLR
jgi:DnaJ like chaperone protein